MKAILKAIVLLIVFCVVLIANRHYIATMNPQPVQETQTEVYVETPRDGVLIVEPVQEDTLNWDEFKEALIFIESSGNPYAINESENALGLYQIRPIYLDDCNRIVGYEKFDLADRTDPTIADEMFETYQEHYNKERDIYKAIKLHNPNAGSWYTDRIITRMTSQV